MIRTLAVVVILTAGAVLGFAQPQLEDDPPLAHHLSYSLGATEGGPEFSPVPAVRLVDQLEDALFDVIRATSLHIPAAPVETGQPAESAPYFVAYRIKHTKRCGPAGPSCVRSRECGAGVRCRDWNRRVRRVDNVVTNHLGTAVVDIVKPARILVPSSVDLTSAPPPSGTPDHHKCYFVRSRKDHPRLPIGTEVTVLDAWMTTPKRFEIGALRQLCLPVDANDGEGITEGASVLACYVAKPAAGEPEYRPQVGLWTTNEFGSLQSDLLAESSLCVPSEVSLGPDLNPPRTPSPTDVPIPTSTLTPVGTATPTPLPSPTVPLPPDPVDVAPPIDASGSTSVSASTSFLYEGPEPIQAGVVPGALAAGRIAVVRGRVFQADGGVLGGVRVAVKGGPEFGSTMSREDGAFDLAVNARQALVLEYTKEGFISAQRRVEPAPERFSWAADVHMIPYDGTPTRVDLASLASTAVVRGSVENDDDGRRQATLLVSPGTTASMRLPDGSTESLPTLTIRATEYTVGANGPERMPMPLPPSSAYTYAIEYSVDEALAAGATDVVFDHPDDKPLIHYVENFLGFATGMSVPVGYYDRQKSVWVPSANGRVVRILSESGGVAVLDVKGTGQPATTAALLELRVTQDELSRLAEEYDPGATLWRVPIEHFTPWDCNWPRVPPADARPPTGVPPPSRSDPRPLASSDDSCRQGSLIEVSSQVLREEIPIVGTPYSLHYASDRVAGRNSRTATIPLSGDTLPASLVRIELEVQIAGQRHLREVAPSPNLTSTFVWDGRDAYGRRVQGEQIADVTIGYVYPAQYAAPADVSQAFARFSNTPLIGNSAREEITITSKSQVRLGGLDSSSEGLGGWTLTPHHFIDRRSETLYEGSGERRSLELMARTISTVAGPGRSSVLGDGGPATAAYLNRPAGLAVDARGNLFISDYYNSRIRRVDAVTGIISTVAGTGIRGYSGDLGPANVAQLAFPTGLAFDPSGNLFLVDSGNDVVRRIDATTGIITTVAGGGHLSSGDGGPAVGAGLRNPADVAVDGEGNLFIAESSGNRIRRVDAATGVITTYAGNGSVTTSGYGGPAVLAGLPHPNGIAVDGQGDVFVANLYRISRIDAVTGLITTAAGNGGTDFSGEGGPAIAAELGRPSDVVVDSSGNLLIAAPGANRILLVDGQSGVLSTLAGTGVYGTSGDGGPASAATLRDPSDLALDPRGNIYVAEWDALRVRRIAGAIDGLAAVASRDGGTLYGFDLADRHVRTVHSLTGATLTEFEFEERGQLARVIEDGRVTNIERDANGRAVAIVSPFGDRTTLTMDDDGYLSSVRNPPGETVRMEYGSGGLLTRFVDATGHASIFAYDVDGRLISDTDALLGSQTLTQSRSTTGRTVSHQTPLGRESAFTIEDAAEGLNFVEVAPDGTIVTRVDGGDGTVVTRDSSGVEWVRSETGDPRFGMAAPVVANASLRMPSGLTSEMQESRSVVLSDPGDQLSVANLVESTELNGAVARTTYDAASRTFTSVSPAGREAYTTIDARGRVVSAQVKGLLPVTISYDPDTGGPATITQGSGASARSMTLAYGPTGNVATVTDPIGRTVEFEYDLAGRLTTQALPGERRVGFGYDPDGNLTSVTPPGRPPHEFAYSALDLLAEYSPPDVGEGATTTSFSYDADRQPTLVTRPDGRQIAFSYDAAGRLIERSSESGDVQYAYDPTTGRLASITNSNGDGLAYEYDGDLLTSTTWTGTVNGTVSRTYDEDLRTASISVNGSAVNYRYDADGLLTKVEGPDGNPNSSDDLVIARDPQKGGLITSTTLGGVTDVRTYDGFGDLETYTVRYNGTQVFRYAFVRDKLGRVTETTETIAASTISEVYLYDDAGRLSEIHRGGVLTASYRYDANGNRLTGTGVAASATYDEQDRLLTFGARTFAYTSSGDVAVTTSGDGTTTFEHDEHGNLVAVALADGRRIGFLYDSANRLIARVVDRMPEQRLLYQADLEPAAELDAVGAVSKRFVYAEHLNVPSFFVASGSTYRVVTDHLGSPRLVINVATGQIVQRIDYDAFGDITNDTNQGFQPFGFAGGINDRSTGLLKLGARIYDPTVGRWLEKDPSWLSGRDSNLYAYSYGDPINVRDVSGEIGIVGCGAGAAFGGFVGLVGGAAELIGRIGVRRLTRGNGRLVTGREVGEVLLTKTLAGIISGCVIGATGGFGAASSLALGINSGLVVNAESKGIAVRGALRGFLSFVAPSAPLRAAIVGPPVQFHSFHEVVSGDPDERTCRGREVTF